MDTKSFTPYACLHKVSSNHAISREATCQSFLWDVTNFSDVETENVQHDFICNKE